MDSIRASEAFDLGSIPSGRTNILGVTMNTNKTKVDMNTFERKGLFDYFMQFSQPRYCITTPIDITSLYEYCKVNKHLNARLVYAITKACNNVENFKYFIEDENTIYKYDCLHAGNAFATNNNQIRYGIIDINQDIDNFIKEYDSVKDEIYSSCSGVRGDCEENFVGLSCIRWFKFSGMHEITYNRFHSGPEITWDKIEIKDGKATINMAIAVNHALVDGYHLHLFIDSLNEEISKLSK